jgi:V-type H+-transporting ATPase subunit e
MALPPIAIPFIVMTGFWGTIGLIVPCFIPKGPNKGLTQLIIVETAVVCYMFWICTFLMQLNPLVGPQLHNDTVYVIQHEWATHSDHNVSSAIGGH